MSVELPEGTMIGNPLYCPVRTDEGYSFEFRTAPGGLWNAAVPNFVRRRYIKIDTFKGDCASERKDMSDKWKSEGIAQGALYLKEVTRLFKINLLIMEIGAEDSFSRPLSLEEALDEELLRETDYGYYLREHYPKNPKLIAQAKKIHHTQNRLYSVTRKGHNLVCIDILSGKRTEKKLEEDQSEFGFLPKPVPAI